MQIAVIDSHVYYVQIRHAAKDVPLEEQRELEHGCLLDTFLKLLSRATFCKDRPNCAIQCWYHSPCKFGLREVMEPEIKQMNLTESSF